MHPPTPPLSTPSPGWSPTTTSTAASSERRRARTPHAPTTSAPSKPSTRPPSPPTEASHEAPTAAGLPTRLDATTELPFDVYAAVWLDDQAHFPPRRYCL